jgi:hypothetical protein
MTTTLLSFGYDSIKPGGERLSELQQALNARHASTKRIVFIGAPYHALPDDAKLPKDYPVADGLTWYRSDRRPLGLDLKDVEFTSFRTLKDENGKVHKPSWASALARKQGFELIGDLGTGKLSVHDSDGEIINYYDGLDGKTVSQIEKILENYPGVPFYATGAWRERGAPKGATLLTHEDEARLTAKSVARFVPGSFTLIEMGKGSTQIVDVVDFDRPPLPIDPLNPAFVEFANALIAQFLVEDPWAGDLTVDDVVQMYEDNVT